MRPLGIATSKKLFVDVDVRQHVVIVNPQTLSPSTLPKEKVRPRNESYLFFKRGSTIIRASYEGKAQGNRVQQNG